MTTTTAFAAKSPDGEIDPDTASGGDVGALLRLTLGNRNPDEPVKSARKRLLSAGWRIVKVKIEEVE